MCHMRLGIQKHLHAFAPAFESMEWPICDPFTNDKFRMQMNRDIQASMKFTFSSKYVGVNWFMPSLVFVYFFKSIPIHHTKTTWVCKEITQQLLDNLLYPCQDVKEGGVSKEITISVKFQRRKWSQGTMLHVRVFLCDIHIDVGRTIKVLGLLWIVRLRKLTRIEIHMLDGDIECLKVNDSQSLNHIR